MKNPQELLVTDDLEKLLDILPPKTRHAVEECSNYQELLEVVLDLGRKPEARFPRSFQYLSERNVAHEELAYVLARVGSFGKDNRAGIERTLHRISAIRNRRGEIIGLTCRVGRAVFGTIQIIRDIVESGKSILLLGRPGVGKTTMLREVARVLADEFRKRVIIVDTSNEIAGDGDIPHPGIGGARRMQVGSPEQQHSVMIEAVENHMPEVIVVDEIGTEADAYAARTIAERGVQLVATAHGNSLENLLVNPTLCDLVGGIQAVTLSDEEARKRRTRKTVLERKAPPTFDVVIEIQGRDSLAIHDGVDRVVDLMLRGTPPQPEIRVRGEQGQIEVVQTSNVEALAEPASPSREILEISEQKAMTRLFPYAISRNRLDRAVENLKVSARVVKNWGEADAIITLKSQERRESKKLRELARHGVSVHIIKSNTVVQIEACLREIFHLPYLNLEELALKEAEEAAMKVLRYGEAVELSAQGSYIRRLQHQVIEKYRLRSRSTGSEPHRRLMVYPD
ncbi:MAG: AAA family ATPase [Armatimonadetes bacterium]|nr:AAA family ATPase [Armatimonadota bacterium]